MTGANIISRRKQNKENLKERKSKRDKMSVNKQNSSVYRIPGESGYQVDGAPGVVHHSHVGHLHDTISPYNSRIEETLRNATQPLDTVNVSPSSTERISVGPFSGVYLNKHEVDSWSGPIPIDQYPINTNDPNPEVIKKKLDTVNYVQQCGVRYLQPTGASARPGDIVIKERRSHIPPAPPVVIRQESGAQAGQETVVYREAPPPKPVVPGELYIEVNGEKSVPSRRVIVEKMTNLPAPPPNVIIEKWLPYPAQQRRVIYKKCQCNGAWSEQHYNKRNLIIEWLPTDKVNVTKKCVELGVVPTDPDEYMRLYGESIKQQRTWVRPECESHCSVVPHLADQRIDGKWRLFRDTKETRPWSWTLNDYSVMNPTNNSGLPQLVGDVHALKLIDLDKYGLAAYRDHLHRHDSKDLTQVSALNTQ